MCQCWPQAQLVSASTTLATSTTPFRLRAQSITPRQKHNKDAKRRQQQEKPRLLESNIRAIEQNKEFKWV